jgi:DNA-binding GntR family transcriptional regulator
MDEGLIQVQAMAARVACLRMTAQHLKALQDSVEYASCLPARSQWDRKAAAHAEILPLLADAADDPVLAPLLGIRRRNTSALMRQRPPRSVHRSQQAGRRAGNIGAQGWPAVWYERWRADCAGHDDGAGIPAG